MKLSLALPVLALVVAAPALSACEPEGYVRRATATFASRPSRCTVSTRR